MSACCCRGELDEVNAKVDEDQSAASSRAEELKTWECAPACSVHSLSFSPAHALWTAHSAEHACWRVRLRSTRMGGPHRVVATRLAAAHCRPAWSALPARQRASAGLTAC